MGERKATLQEHLGEIPQAEFVAQAPEQDQEDDVSGKRELVVGRAGPLIALMSTGGAPKGPIPKLGALRQFSRCRGGAVRAGHPGLPGKLDSAPTGYQKSRGASMPKLRSDGTQFLVCATRSYVYHLSLE